MKRFLKISLGLLLTITLSAQIASANFSDVTQSHQNYDAITYLQENNIIHGYEDGTFKPNNEVNRAEFLKIILEGSSITLDKDESTILPFSDVIENEWYTPYVRKAYAEGWVVGYGDGTFKPEQTINKAEALKILGEVQQWPLTETSTAPFKDTPKLAWYTKYVDYGKTNSYLEESGDYFYPETLMTRAKISEIIYRTLIQNSNDQPPSQDDTTDPIEESPFTEPPDEEPEEIDFTPLEYENISRVTFDDVKLDYSIPNTFYKNEVYVISGEITSGDHSETLILLDPDDDNDSNYETFIGDVEDDRFSIPIHFRESGNYQIGIIPGVSGNTKIKDISVLPALPDPKSTDASNTQPNANSLNIDFENNHTFVEYETDEDTIKKLRFIQNNEKVTYISRQNINSIYVNYSDFADFTEGEVYFYIETADLDSEKPLEIASSFTKTSPDTLEAVQHTYDSISENVSASPPDRLEDLQTISFIGSLDTEAQVLAYVIKPDGFVDSVNLSTTSSTSDHFGTEVMEPNADFQFEYTPLEEGRYIIEILDKNGVPTLNHPIYIGEGIPLIPDYFDLNERVFFEETFDLENLKEELLTLINESRTEHGLEEIVMSEELNSLAQSHSQDMIDKAFFGHINPDNETPEDRRIAAGIATSVSENIAKDVSITFAHLGLMRSASHRENTLRPDWTRVGLGIALEDGYLYISEEFSTSIPVAEDLEIYKEELLTEINDSRSTNGLGTLTYDGTIESACAYLNNKTIQEKISLTNADLVEALDIYDIDGTSQYIGRTYNIWSEILSSILEDEESVILDSSWNKIGINIQVDANGYLHTTFMINKP